MALSNIMNRFHYSLKTISLLLFTLLLAACYSAGVTELPEVKGLKNTDVSWGGTIAGLVPTLNEKAKKVLALGKQAIPSLLSALDDQERFAVAHVLLTFLKFRTVETSGSTWNELRIDVHGDGHVDYHPEQIPELKQLWFRLLNNGAI